MTTSSWMCSGGDPSDLVSGDLDHEAYQGAVYDQNCAANELNHERADLESRQTELAAAGRTAEEMGALSDADGYRSAANAIDQDLAFIAAELAIVRTDEWLHSAAAANAEINATSAAAFNAAAEATAARNAEYGW